MHFEKDMKKDNLLQAGGYSVIHFSDYMLTWEAEAVAELVRLKLNPEGLAQGDRHVPDH